LSDTLFVRALERADLAAVALVLDGTGLFPPDLLAPMAEPFLSGAAPHHWLVACEGGRPIGFVYCEPERMTEGTFNLLAIAVLPERQRGGVGRELVRSLEARLRRARARVLLVETSSLDEYARTRAFYDREGFSREALIRDFYTEGEHKVVFRKRL